jgi:hypothetical protein
MPRAWPARRAGHGVAVLLKVYANCIDGQADSANQRINDALDRHDSVSQRALQGNPAANRGGASRRR